MLSFFPDKPPIEELQYFLEFQIQRVWAPAPSSIPGHQRKEPVCPSLQFSLMGPKLYISSEQVQSILAVKFFDYRFCVIHLYHLQMVTITVANSNKSLLVAQDCPSSSFLNLCLHIFTIQFMKNNYFHIVDFSPKKRFIVDMGTKY